MKEKPPEQTARQSEAPDQADLDAQADELIEQIASQTGSMYAVHAGGEAENLDPNKLHVEDLEEGDSFSEDVARDLTLDEPAEAIDLESLERAREQARAWQERQEQEARLKDSPVNEHRGLKRALVIILILLALIICALGVLIWHNSIAPDTEQADTEALITNQAGTSNATFEQVDASKIPELSKVFGKKAKSAVKALGSQFSAEGSNKKSTDARVTAMKRVLEGTWVDANGDAVASIGLGLNKKGRVVYAYVLYNLDTIGVAESSFAELVNDDTVASSVLSGAGIESPTLGTPELDVDDSSRETATFAGKTGKKKAPTAWQLSEAYAHSSDGATTRTLLLELW